MSYGRISSSTSRNVIDSQVYTGFAKLLCACGDEAILRSAKTVNNYGKLFWGCKHFKGNSNSGCGFFEWFHEECRDEKEETLMKHEWKIQVLSQEMDVVRKETEDLKLKTLELEELIEKTKKWKSI
ncbi:uncharacterized protein LOC131615033 [Vicia villosa]|uniref:uncharacterized protein LOC131615033 n=1 Tax=Vicia villosa TaxID=3911 RepID=UPI00273CF011|nr:uncharacterized protein LOC131615033 [Vicia villosa]